MRALLLRLTFPLSVLGTLVFAGVDVLPAAGLAAAGTWVVAWLRGAPRVIRAEVRAVHQDPDFGRLGLFGDRVWRGSVELPGLPRPLDLEIEAEGVGPTLAHRLALRDARRRWPRLGGEIDRRLRSTTGCGAPSYLTLRLPLEGEFARQDWSIEGLLPATDGGRGFQVRVRDGDVVGVELAA